MEKIGLITLGGPVVAILGLVLYGAMTGKIDHWRTRLGLKPRFHPVGKVHAKH